MDSWSDSDEQEGALSCDLVFRTKLPPTPAPRLEAASQPPPTTRKPQPKITTAAFCAATARFYYGLDSGDLCFWPLQHDGTGTARYVGTHKGPVTCICLPSPEDGELGKAGLILSGSVDGNIKIWEYQGRVIQKPTVCVQTLYGHTGTITGLFAYGPHIVSSSTDKTIKIWKAVDGRQQLVYPWYNLQTTVATLDGWVRSMSYDRSAEVGDIGTFFAVDESGSIVKILPEETVDGEGNRTTAHGYTFRLDSLGEVGGSSWPGAGALTSPPGSAGGAAPGGSISGAGGGGPGPPGTPLMGAGGVGTQYALRSSHDRGVLMVRYIAPWHLLLTLCYDNCLRAYDSITGELKHEWENENKCLFTGLEVDLEYAEIWAVDKTGTLAIFSVRSGFLLATKSLSDQPIVRIMAVSGKQRFAVVTERELSVWHLEHELDYGVLRGGHTRAVIALYACSGGTGAIPSEPDFRIFSASLDNTMRLWDPYDMACVRVMSESESEISAMTFYEAWNILVTGHDNGSIRLWDLDTGSSTTLRQQHTNSVTSLVLALLRRNEELLVSAGYDGQVVLWDIRSLRNEPPHMIAKFKAAGPDLARTGVNQAPGAAPMLAARMGSLIRQTPRGEGTGATATPRPDGAGSEPSTGGVGGGLGGHLSSTSDVASSMSLSALATHNNSSAGALDSQQQGGGGDGGGAGNVPDANGGGVDGDASAALSVLALEPEILVVKYDSVKKVLITAGTDRVVRVWSAHGYYLVGQHVGHTDAVVCLALDANLLFSGSEDMTIRVWDTVPAQSALAGLGAVSRKEPLPSPSAGPTHPPSLMPALSTMSLASKDPVPIGFTSAPIKVLTGHTRCVTGLEVNPATGHLISVSLDGSLRFWDYVVGTVLFKYTHHEEFRCLALRFDKNEVLVGTKQASILRYAAPERIDSARPSTASYLHNIQGLGALSPSGSPPRDGGSLSGDMPLPPGGGAGAGGPGSYTGLHPPGTASTNSQGGPPTQRSVLRSGDSSRPAAGTGLAGTGTTGSAAGGTPPGTSGLNGGDRVTPTQGLRVLGGRRSTNSPSTGVVTGGTGSHSMAHRPGIAPTAAAGLQGLTRYDVGGIGGTGIGGLGPTPQEERAAKSWRYGAAKVNLGPAAAQAAKERATAVKTPSSTGTMGSRLG